MHHILPFPLVSNRHSHALAGAVQSLISASFLQTDVVLLLGLTYEFSSRNGESNPMINYDIVFSASDVYLFVVMLLFSSLLHDHDSVFSQSVVSVSGTILDLISSRDDKYTMASGDVQSDESLYPIAVLIDELRNEDVQVIRRRWFLFLVHSLCVF